LSNIESDFRKGQGVTFHYRARMYVIYEFYACRHTASHASQLLTCSSHEDTKISRLHEFGCIYPDSMLKSNNRNGRSHFSFIVIFEIRHENDIPYSSLFLFHYFRQFYFNTWQMLYRTRYESTFLIIEEQIIRNRNVVKTKWVSRTNSKMMRHSNWIEREREREKTIDTKMHARCAKHFHENHVETFDRRN